MSRPVRALAPALAALLACASLAAAALAEDTKPAPTIYRWVDQNGVVHYTADPERVPESLRGQLPERRALGSAPLSAQAPAAVDAWIAQDRAPEPSGAAAGADADAGVAPETPGGDRAAALDARIAELEAAIAADEQLLKGQLTEEDGGASNEALKQVATRMPARIEELRKLRAEREALGGAPAPAE